MHGRPGAGVGGSMRQTDIDEALVKRTNPTGAAEGQASKAPSVLLGLLANSRRQSLVSPPPPPPAARTVPATPATHHPPVNAMPSRVSSDNWNRPTPAAAAGGWSCQPEAVSDFDYRGGAPPPRQPPAAAFQGQSGALRAAPAGGAPHKKSVVDFGAPSAPPPPGSYGARGGTAGAGSSVEVTPACECTVVYDTTAVPGKLLLTGNTYPLKEIILNAAWSAGLPKPHYLKAPLEGWVASLAAEDAIVSALRDAGATVIDAAITKAVTEAAIAAAEANAAAARAAAAGLQPAPPPPRPVVHAPAVQAAPAPKPVAAPPKAAKKPAAASASAVSDQALRACLLDVLVASDLDTVTPRQVRMEAERRLGTDLTAWKKRVIELTHALFNTARAQQEEASCATAAARPKGQRRRRQKLILGDDDEEEHGGGGGGDADYSPPGIGVDTRKAAPARTPPPPPPENDVIDLCDSESEEKAPKVARKTSGKAHAGCAGEPIIALLLDMGFDASQARAAAEATGFASVDAAVDWLSNQPQEPPSQAAAADPHAAASMAAAAAAAAERAKAASDKLTALQHEKERARQEAARNAAQRANKAAAPPAKKPRIGTCPPRAGAGWHYAPGDVVYAGDVLNTRGGGGGFGWEGMGTTNLGGMDDFFSL